MGFKLGSTLKQIAQQGEVQNKMRFNQEDASVPGTPIIRTKLEKGILGEANADGSIFISENIEPGSFQERQTLKHEMVHAKDMRISPNKLSYGDDYVRYNGETYMRKQIRGKDMILFEGQWIEAGEDGKGGFPWEDEANQQAMI